MTNYGNRITTVTHPSAGMLSLMALKWLKKVDVRFFSLKLWIPWIAWEVGANNFTKSASAGALDRDATTRNWR